VRVGSEIVGSDQLKHLKPATKDSEQQDALATAGSSKDRANQRRAAGGKENRTIGAASGQARASDRSADMKRPSKTNDGDQ